MATTEKFRTRLARARAESVQSGRVVLGMPAVLGAARAGCCFLLAAVLSGGVIMGSSAPFGVALVGGAGSGMNAAAALLGTCVGYVALLGLVEGLRYVAAAILTFSVAFAFCDTGLYRSAWTMPAAAAAMNGCAGFIYLSQRGWHTRDVVCFALEVVLTALFACGFRAALAGPERLEAGRRRLGGILLLTAVLISLAQLRLFFGVSLGGVLAGVVVLAAACRIGTGGGAAFGVLLGVAMDLAGGQTPMYAMCMGVAGLAAGLCSGRRARAAGCFVLTGIFTVLWLWDGGLQVGMLCELAAAGVLFLAVPAGLRERAGVLFLREQEGQVQDGAREYVSQRLTAAAQAFHSLHETMRSAFRRTPPNDGDTASVFDRAADRVCRGCALRGACWERDYVTTFNALNDAAGAMLRRGSAEAEDFPAHFSGKCIRFREFLAAVNRELTGLLCRRQYASRIRDSRRTVCSQYGQLSQLLTEAAQELGQPLTADPARRRRLRQHLSLMGLEGDGAVFYDRDHHLRVRICGPAAGQLAGEREVSGLSDLMGMPLYVLEQEEQGCDRYILFLDQLLSGGLVNSRHISGKNPVTLSDGTVLTEMELLDQLMTTLAADKKNRVWLLDTVMRLAPTCGYDGFGIEEYNNLREYGMQPRPELTEEELAALTAHRES